MKMPWPVMLGGVALAVVGAAGLIWGAVPLRSGGSGSANVDPIVVTNAYVRPPAPPNKTAAAYFTIYNTTGTPDRLLSVTTGAGAVAVLHTAGMKPAPDGVVVPAHGKLVLSTGNGHVMIEQLFGPLLPGETVNMDLQFQNAGVVPVTAKVIALGAPVPTGGSS